MMRKDKNAAPEYGERLPYVIIYGRPVRIAVSQSVEKLDKRPSRSPIGDSQIPGSVTSWKILCQEKDYPPSCSDL